VTPENPPAQPSDEALLLDLLQGELAPEARAALEARLECEPALAAALAGWRRLQQAERTAFEPARPDGAWQVDAARVAARVRAAGRTAARRPARGRAARARGWARILAWSVAAHVVALAILALVLRGREEVASDRVASIRLDEDFAYREAPPDYDSRAGALTYRNLVQHDLGRLGDELALVEQEDLGDLPLDTPLSEAQGSGLRGSGAQDYPAGVIVPMTRRQTPGLKRRRLELLGFDARGTLKAVDRGLRFLEARQDPGDGSFPPGPGRSRVTETAVATLAFLGDGYTSEGHKPRDAVVRRSVAWLRRQTFPGEADPARGAGAGHLAVHDPHVLAPLGIALCEDYMLSYGALTPQGLEQRAVEIGRLAEGVRAALASEAVQGTERTWLLWALDASRRAGLVRESPEERSAFRGWVARASADADPVARGPEDALIAGTALLYAERGTSKPRFTHWSRQNGEGLVARLDDPRGGVRSAHPVGDTARVLLALQVAYRTY
jgi:anti-sigma-K factor RskA